MTARTMTGRTMMVPIADIGPQAVPLSVMKAEMATGSVLALSGPTAEAKRNSFHEKNAVSSPAVTIAGMVSGSTMAKNRRGAPRPAGGAGGAGGRGGAAGGGSGN